MRNKNKKIIAIVLFVIASGLLIYNISNPYQEQSSNDNTVVASSSSLDNTDEAYPLTSELSDEVVVEKEPSQEEVWREKYSGNQLANGAQPYSSLYGKNKKSGSAQIRIKAPIGDDVIVMVKNTNGKVVRHAYIRNNNNYTFHLSPGEYQVYFIFGTDWCPEKEAPNGQKGYFLHSSTSKDYPQYIDEYQILEYTLQSVTNGNFQPQGADSEEAF